MSGSRSLLVFLGDPKLSAHATADYPVWLWSADATHILWGNAVAAAIFGADSPSALTRHSIDPKGSAALQIARLAATLPHGAAPRLERLRGFDGRIGGALMCGCSRIILADRTPAILVVATESAGPRLPLEDRARRLLTGSEEPLALFAADGTLLRATPGINVQLGDAASLDAVGVGALAGDALASGRASGNSRIGSVSLERLGNGASSVLLAAFDLASEATEPQPDISITQQTAPISAATSPALDDEVFEDSKDASPSPAPLAVPMLVDAAPVPPAAASAVVPTISAADRRQPLRFVWLLDADGRFTVDSDEFVTLIGPKSAAVLGQPWTEIANTFALDPEGQVARALDSRETWSGISVAFPADGTDARLTVELSGLPVFDRDRSFRGYRGFGVCRDIGRIAELARLRRGGAPLPPRVEPPVFRETPTLTVVPPSENVVPFRSSAPQDKPPTLTPVERNAFSELASRLTARLRGRDAADAPLPGDPAPATAEPSTQATTAKRAETPGSSADQRPILDRLPVGVLVYRLDKLIYANRAFLDWTGYDHLRSLEDAGGLDALFVEPSGSDLNANNGAKTLTIATNCGDQLPVEARLFTSPWEGESALVLMLTGAGLPEKKPPQPASAMLASPGTDSEWRAVVDATTDGVLVLDRERKVLLVNHGAEELFGYRGDEWHVLPFASLFGPEAQRVALDYIASSDLSAYDDGREVSGRRKNGGLVPLFMTVGRIGGEQGRLVVTFRDITRWKKAEYELLGAKRRAETASSAKTEFLARLSHEIRTPLNAIIGFTEVMMQERFGPIGNDRYRQYLKDISTSGGHVVSLLNDLLDLSKIEAGKLELNFALLDLNGIVQECVALMQPQASRERIIIRTSLANELPHVTADSRSVKQILLNILSNSIKFTGAGGQVIVSTGPGEAGDVVLRVRDTGVGMSEQELAVALEPFRQLATSARFGSGGTGLGLPLTKALAEANRASFSIRSAVNSGTLVEVSFQGTRMAAE